MCFLYWTLLDSASTNRVIVVDSIPCDPQIPMDTQSYPHLLNLPTIKMENDQSVDLHIGQDNSQALIPINVARGNPRDPYAVRTLFGWSLHGMSKQVSPVSKRVIANFVTIIEGRVNKLWDIEEQHIGTNRKGWSQEDRSVIQEWDKNMIVHEGHIQLPILWKRDHLENNFIVDVNRLKHLNASLRKSDLYEQYEVAMNTMLEKNYAERVPKEELYNNNPRTWYLPHHHVKKKDGSMRLVFDCASRFRGASLNDTVRQGPNLNNKLSNVLLRFRLHKYAITADQVLVSIKDRDYIRFLWGPDDSYVQYRMSTHIFRGIWSASAATYALQQCINVTDDVLLRQTILHSFYVDDLVVSLKTSEETRAVIHDLKCTLRKRGFNLKKYIINDKNLMSEVAESDRSEEGLTQLMPDDSSKSKALGLIWNVREDFFSFNIHADCTMIYTKDKMLSRVASVFDPLGLVSPVTITGMLLFQEATRLRLGWRDELPDMLNRKWTAWLASLENLPHIKVPRCVKPEQYDDANTELHIFSDASEHAYGCCIYMRSVNRNGKIHVSLLCSKNKVAPIKTVSIPRLELQGAHMAAVMDHSVREELFDVVLAKSTFWTDSMITLSYVKNKTSRFHVFVSNRISIILQYSDPSQWHHIPGADNPADILTRGISVSQLNDSWIEGPSFLWKYKSEWVKEEASQHHLHPCDPEVKRTYSRHNMVIPKYHDHPITALNNIIQPGTD